MLRASEREERTVLHMFVSSWPLSTVHGSFICFASILYAESKGLLHLFSQLKIHSAFWLLIKPYEKSFLCMRVLIHKSARTHTHTYMCTIYTAIMSLNVLFHLQNKGGFSLLPSLLGQ